MMTQNKLVDLINKKFKEYEIDDIPNEIYCDFRGNFVVNFTTLNVSDNECIVFVGENSTIYNYEFFNDYNEADKYFKYCVKIFVK